MFSYAVDKEDTMCFASNGHLGTPTNSSLMISCF